MDNTIERLLNELEHEIENSKTVPFSNKISVEKQLLMDIISDIRMNMPDALKHARYVIEERDKILVSAQKEADEILKNAEDRVIRMVDDHEVTKKAYEQATAIMESAKKASKEMRIGAMDYAEQILEDAEDKLKELKAVAYEESIKTDDYFVQT